MESFVGIDVSQRRLDVHVTPGDDAFHVSRDADGIEALVRRLQALAPAIVALEASGGFETVVAAGLAGLSGIPCVLGHDGMEGAPACLVAKNHAFRMPYLISFWAGLTPRRPSTRAGYWMN